MPHAAADTDHPSRVAGARQAVDQIFDLIQYREVTNLKGDLPEGFSAEGQPLARGRGRSAQGASCTALAADDAAACQSCARCRKR